MATLNQIKVNIGTEDNPSYVLHDVHDKRLDDGASSLVTTCTHLLATNAALSSFNPITSANLASVLGVPRIINVDLNNMNTLHYLKITYIEYGCYIFAFAYGSVEEQHPIEFNIISRNAQLSSYRTWNSYTDSPVIVYQKNAEVVLTTDQINRRVNVFIIGLSTFPNTTILEQFDETGYYKVFPKG